MVAAAERLSGANTKQQDHLSASSLIPHLSAGCSAERIAVDAAKSPLGSQGIHRNTSSSRFPSTESGLHSDDHRTATATAYPQTHNQPHSPSSSGVKTSKKIVNDYYQWPVFMAILPPLLTLYYGGRVEEWSEAFLLVVVGCYLYGLIKLPWELYVAAHWASVRNQQQSANRVSVAYAQQIQQQEKEKEKGKEKEDLVNDPERIRKTSAFRLWFLEKFYFALVFASPLGGALFLRYIRPHLHVYQNLINEFPMALYVLTAYIRPMVYLSRLLKGQISALAAEIEYPVSEVALIKQRMEELECRLTQLWAICHDTREEVQSQVTQIFEHKFDPQLRDINKDLRKTTKFERRFAEHADERLRELEERLQTQNEWIMANRHVVDDLNGHYKQRQRFLLRPFYWLIDSVPSLSVTSFVVMPIHVAGAMIDWLVPGPVKRALLSAPPSATTREVIDMTQQRQQHPSLFKRRSITNGGVSTPPPPLPEIDDRLSSKRSNTPVDFAPKSHAFINVIDADVNDDDYDDGDAGDRRPISSTVLLKPQAPSSSNSRRKKSSPII